MANPTQPAGTPSDHDLQQAEMLVQAYDRACTELGKVIVGQNDVIEQLMIAVLARGHCLLEGVPGLAKTLMVRSLAQALDLSFRRIQFTPDLMPADIVGTDIIQEDPTTGHRNLVFEKGPIFSQMILADEINRTPPKTQAALLEAMQEHSVTVGGKTYLLQEPFFVLATMNPIEQEGTYPLPEAQRDRFLLLVKVDYPDRAQERQIVLQTTGKAASELSNVLTGEQIIACQEVVRKVPVPDHVLELVLDLVRTSRPTDPDAPAWVKEFIEWGPGPRACQHLVLAAKVRALLKKRTHVTADDIEALALPVMRHRIVPTFAAEAEGITVDNLVAKLLAVAKQSKSARVV